MSSRRATFIKDDPFGLWVKGDTAEYLGRESDHPDAPPIHLFRLDDGQLLSLTDPFGRYLVLPSP